MNLTKNGLTITVSDSELTRLVFERLNSDANGCAAPAIGEPWQGGIYAGIARGRDGQADHHLIAGPEFDGDVTWDNALTWVEDLCGEKSEPFSFVLPTRKEQALLFANVPELFKDRAYWSSEQHAADSGYAWFQDFNDGYQGLWDKGYELRARAVRRLPIR